MTDFHELISSLGPDLISNNKSLLDKVKEIDRLITQKYTNPNKSSFNNGKYIAIEMACRILKIGIDRSKLIRLSQRSPEEYKKTFTTIKSVLSLRWESPINESFAIKYSPSLISDTHHLVHAFKQHNSVVSHGCVVNYDQPEYICAAMYVLLTMEKSVRLSFFLYTSEKLMSLTSWMWSQAAEAKKDREYLVELSEGSNQLFSSTLTSLSNFVSGL